jgi:hypothetical protein
MRDFTRTGSVRTIGPTSTERAPSDTDVKIISSSKVAGQLLGFLPRIPERRLRTGHGEEFPIVDAMV